MNAEKCDIQKLAREIASHLEHLAPMGWAYLEPGIDGPALDRAETWAIIARTDGAAISLHYRSYQHPKMISISGAFPRTSWGEDCGPYRDRPGINVSPNRAPELIAADIERRFIAEYITKYDAALRTRDQCEASAARATHEAEELARILSGHVRGEKMERKVYSGDCEGVRVEAAVMGGHDWTFDIRGLSFDLARGIAETIAAHVKKP